MATAAASETLSADPLNRFREETSKYKLKKSPTTEKTLGLLEVEQL